MLGSIPKNLIYPVAPIQTTPSSKKSKSTQMKYSIYSFTFLSIHMNWTLPSQNTTEMFHIVSHLILNSFPPPPYSFSFKKLEHCKKHIRGVEGGRQTLLMHCNSCSRLDISVECSSRDLGRQRMLGFEVHFSTIYEYNGAPVRISSAKVFWKAR